MRIAFASDLHLEHREGPVPVDVSDDEFHLYGSVTFPRCLPADVLVLAGDVHSNPVIVQAVLAKLRATYGFPVFFIEGNHEYYGGSFPALRPMGEYENINGVSFAGATLWTKLSPMDEIGALSFPDFQHISGLTVQKWNAQHDMDKLFLAASNADVIVTHHAPTRHSCHPNYTNASLNAFFINDLDVEAMAPNCKLWIHGHVHQDFDYRVGNTRVVCCPTAYPWENEGARIKIVQI